MSQRFGSRVAVVTGASKGIGAAIARRLASEGAAVVVGFGGDRPGADRVVESIRGAGGRAMALQADMTRAADVERLFTAAVREFGRLDVLVNNAGVYRFVPLAEIDEAHYREHFDLNVLGLLLASREAAKRFGPEGGSIVNIGSVVTSLAPAASAVYTATKSAVDGITRVLATELGPRKIRVNAVKPGMVVTEGLRAAGFDQGEFRSGLEAETPLGRIGAPDDIAPAVAFLASQEASWITGETLTISGGLR